MGLRGLCLVALVLSQGLATSSLPRCDTHNCQVSCTTTGHPHPECTTGQPAVYCQSSSGYECKQCCPLALPPCTPWPACSFTQTSTTPGPSVTTATETSTTPSVTPASPPTSSSAPPLAPTLGLVKYQKPNKPLVFHHTTQSCTSVGCEEVVPLRTFGKPFPPVSSAINIPSPHPLVGQFWVPWGESDTCQVNVSIALKTLMGYVYRGPQTSCFELIVVGKLSATQCVLPAHCGAIASSVVHPGWFSDSVLCVGVGPERPTTLGGLTVPSTFHPYYTVEFEAGPNSFAQRFYVVYDGLYRLLPKWVVDNSVVMGLDSKLIVPPLFETSDGRFCYKGPVQGGMVNNDGCYSKTLDQLLCACRVPTLTGPEPSEDAMVRSAELTAVWLYVRVGDRVRPAFGMVDESLQTHCEAYLTTTTYISQFMKSLVAHLLQALWTVVRYLWYGIVAVAEEIAAFFVSKRVASTMFWTIVVVSLLVARGGWPDKLVYQCSLTLMIFVGFQEIQPLLTRSS